MADQIQAQLGVSCTLIPGSRGIFTVAVADRVVAQKTLNGFPDDAECVAAVRDALS